MMIMSAPLSRWAGRVEPQANGPLPRLHLAKHISEPVIWERYINQPGAALDDDDEEEEEEEEGAALFL